MTTTWLQFFLCVIFIGFAGVKLSHYADVIAEKTAMGGTWIGLILLATVTSLPELITGISSVTLAQVPNIAIGDALGSCVFNLLIIVIIDFLHRKESVYILANQGHILSAGFGILLIGLVAVNILLSQHGALPAMFHIGFYTPILFLLYILAIRTVFYYEQKHIKIYTEKSVKRYSEIKLKQAIIGYSLAALVVVLCAAWLPFVGNMLAAQMKWHKSFVGTLFIAFATSVPELVVTIAAVNIGSLDMAIANLFGSNLFDMLIIAIDDLLYKKSPILASVAPIHAVTAVSAMIMSGTAIIGLLYRPPGKVLKTVGWASIFLLIVYLGNAYTLYLHGN
ncbi:MAG TPA: sodium:calcium antiporter [Burkholderiales bacterium]|nr:sodium:calcium antiporter [Burkholderiales bacterium]